MADIFAPIVKKVLDLGFGNLFVFALAAAMVWALLKKSKILGESESVNGTISIVSAFLIAFVFPLMTGMSLTTNLSLFFTQALSFFLFLVVGFLGASLFYPDLGKLLSEQFKHRSSLWVMLVAGITLFITSGLVSTLWASGNLPKIPGSRAIDAPASITIIGTALILLIVVIVIASAVTLQKEG